MISTVETWAEPNTWAESFAPSVAEYVETGTVGGLATVSFYRSVPDFAAHKLEALEKLDCFAKFPAGWHFGEGDKFTELAISEIRKLILYGDSLGLSESDLFPGQNGELQLVFYVGEVSFVVTRYGHSDWEILSEIGDDDEELLDQGNFFEVVRILKETAEQGGKYWRASSESYLRTHGTVEKSVSGAWHFRSQALEEEYQSFFETAEGNPVVRCVVT